MTNKDFLSQLNTLKEIRPQSAWLKSNREILLSQISNSGAEQLSYWQKIIIDLKSFSMVVSKPVVVMASLFAFLVGTSAFAHLAFNSTRPNDSLYIAKIISEKAKLSTVFNAQEREKLEAQFAAGHAEGISSVLAEAKIDDSNEDQLASLNNDFNKEINIVREKIAVISKNVKKDESTVNNDVNVEASSSVEDLVSVADNGKDEQGTQISINNDNNTDTVKASTTDTKVETEIEIDNKVEELKNPELILEEAQVLFDSKNYQGALDKIKEVKELIK